MITSEHFLVKDDYLSSRQLLGGLYHCDCSSLLRFSVWSRLTQNMCLTLWAPKVYSVVLFSFCKRIFCLPRPSIWRWVHVSTCACAHMERQWRLESLETFLSLLEPPNINDTWQWFWCDSYSLLTFSRPSRQTYHGMSLLSVSLCDTRLFLLEESLNKFQAFAFAFASNPLSSQRVW